MTHNFWPLPRPEQLSLLEHCVIYCLHKKATLSFLTSHIHIRPLNHIFSCFFINQHQISLCNKNWPWNAVWINPSMLNPSSHLTNLWFLFQFHFLWNILPSNKFFMYHKVIGSLTQKTFKRNFLRQFFSMAGSNFVWLYNM